MQLENVLIIWYNGDGGDWGTLGHLKINTLIKVDAYLRSRGKKLKNACVGARTDTWISRTGLYFSEFSLSEKVTTNKGEA